MLHDRNLDLTRSGPYVRLGVEHALDCVTVGASFERQYVPSFGFGGASNSQELRGYVPDAAAAAPLLYPGHPRPGADRRRSSSTRSSSTRSGCAPTVGYTAARWLRVEALYTFTRQDSVVTGGEVDRHRVGVQFVISQPMRIQ